MEDQELKMETGNNPKLGLRTLRGCVWRTSFSVLVAASVCAAEHPRGVLTPLKTIELNLPPGERSVVELIITGEGKVKGSTTGTQAHTFEYDPTTGRLVATSTPLPRVENNIALLRSAAGNTDYVLNAVGHLLVASLPERSSWTDVGKVAGQRPKEKEGWQVSKALVFDAEGNVYTAGKNGHVYRYSPLANKLEQLPAQLPCVVGRESWASLDAAVLGPDGLIYGGTYDGYIFTFNPKTLEVINYGKPLRQQRTQGLAFSKGRLYGVGGEPNGLPRAFAFDPQTKSFELGGLLRYGIGSYDFIMDPVSAMVADKDGNIYVGSTGRLGNLFVWEVEP